MNKFNLDFKAESVNWERLKGFSGALSGLLDLSNDAKRIFGDVSGEQMFYYLFRRFGFPINGSDDYKDMCRYVITTPNPECALSINPVGVEYSFSYLISEKMEREIRLEQREPVKKWHNQLADFAKEKYNWVYYDEMEARYTDDIELNNIYNSEFEEYTDSIGITQDVFDAEFKNLTKAEKLKMADLPKRKDYYNKFINDWLELDWKINTSEEIINEIGEEKFLHELDQYCLYTLNEKYRNIFWEWKKKENKRIKDSFDKIMPFKKVEHFGQDEKSYYSLPTQIFSFLLKKTSRKRKLLIRVLRKIYWYFEAKDEKKMVADKWWERLPETSQTRQCYEAFCLAMEDLLRPTNIRDCYFNIKGNVDRGHYSEYNEDGEELWSYMAGYAPTSGYGIPLNIYNNIDSLSEISMFIKQLGGGDFENGLVRVKEQLLQPKSETEETEDADEAGTDN